MHSVEYFLVKNFNRVFLLDIFQVSIAYCAFHIILYCECFFVPAYRITSGKFVDSDSDLGSFISSQLNTLLLFSELFLTTLYVCVSFVFACVSCFV